MKYKNLKLLSIDLSNFCSKGCGFCYNRSSKSGYTQWTANQVVDFVKDCADNGIEAVSLGGGEPFEFDGVFEIISAIQPVVYLSVTSNGLPLENADVFSCLKNHRPDKIHLTIHFPDNENEVSRVIKMLKKISSETDITVGVNLLINKNKAENCKRVYSLLTDGLLTPKQIILIPQRFSETPDPKTLLYIADGKPFQSPSCLLKCTPPDNFCSVSWDKKVNFCSYAQGKQPLETIDYNGLINALDKIQFGSCK